MMVSKFGSSPFCQGSNFQGSMFNFRGVMEGLPDPPLPVSGYDWSYRRRGAPSYGIQRTNWVTTPPFWTAMDLSDVVRLLDFCWLLRLIGSGLTSFSWRLPSGKSWRWNPFHRLPLELREVSLEQGLRIWQRSRGSPAVHFVTSFPPKWKGTKQSTVASMVFHMFPWLG